MAVFNRRWYHQGKEVKVVIVSDCNVCSNILNCLICDSMTIPDFHITTVCLHHMSKQRHCNLCSLV